MRLNTRLMSVFDIVSSVYGTRPDILQSDHFSFVLFLVFNKELFGVLNIGAYQPETVLSEEEKNN